jgi:hypothetical protein
MTKIIRHKLEMSNGMTEEYCSCPICGEEVDWVKCDSCEEGYSDHDCGEDTCNCLNPNNNVKCSDCDGKEGWWLCHRCDKYIEDD